MSNIFFGGKKVKYFFCWVYSSVLLGMLFLCLQGIAVCPSALPCAGQHQLHSPCLGGGIWARCPWAARPAGLRRWWDCSLPPEGGHQRAGGLQVGTQF